MKKGDEVTIRVWDRRHKDGLFDFTISQIKDMGDGKGEWGWEYSSEDNVGETEGVALRKAEQFCKEYELKIIEVNEV